jgi:antitoxin (DNA-binding transcriptional repressor) of toxin-antitoxin stability system
MGVISIREFNASVSRTLARVEAGETIEISRNGKIIAELRPKESHKTEDPEWQAARSRLRGLMREGIAFGGPASYDERTS